MDYLLKIVDRKDLEGRFLDKVLTFLINRLAKIQEVIDSGELREDYGKLLMVLYVYVYIEKYAWKYKDYILDFFEKFTGWDFKAYEEFFNLKGSFEERVEWFCYRFSRNEGIPIHKEVLREIILEKWKELNLERDFNIERELKRIEERKKKIYFNFIEFEKRRKMIINLIKKYKKRIDLKFYNIAIVPTEKCMNNCRFCLIPWKPSLDERNVKDIDFEKIAKKVIEFAYKNGLVITITGGEPFLEIDKVKYIIRNAKTPVELTTSAAFARDINVAKKYLEEIYKEAKRNRNRYFRLILQISLDAFHQEVYLKDGELVENIPLSCVANVLQLLQEEFIDLYACLLTKYTTYYDPIVYLLDELKRRGYDVYLTDKVYSNKFLVSVYNLKENKFENKPALLRAYLKFKNGKGRDVLVLYSMVENIGRASLLYDFEIPWFKKRVEELVKGKSSETFKLLGLEVSDDGYVYPSAHVVYTFPLGNLMEDDLEDIVKDLSYDPLIIAMYKDPNKIVKFALEVEPRMINELKNSSSPLVVIYKILENPLLRYYITKRLILDMDYPDEIKVKIGEVSFLKAEYFNLKRMLKDKL